jgi:putative peptidoglycan lipid II flippase
VHPKIPKRAFLSLKLPHYIPNRLRLWHKNPEASVTRKIFSASVVIAICVVTVKGVGLVKEQMVASNFGTGAALAAFLIAFLVPSFFAGVLSGSLNAAFIPTYIRIREQEGEAAAHNLLQRIICLVLVLLSGAGIVILIAGPAFLPLIGKSFNREGLSLARNLLLIVMPLVVITGLNVLWGAVLNAHERFSVAGLAPVANPLVIIAFLFLGKSLGIYALAYGTVIGAILEGAIVVTALMKLKIPVTPRLPKFDSYERQVGIQFLPMISGSFIAGSNNLIDNAMSAMISPSSVAILSYGSRLVGFPVGIGATALGTAAIPYLAILFARHDAAAVRHTIKRFLKLIFCVALPVSFAIALFSGQIVRLVYQRGVFSQADTLIVSSVLASLSVQIPFYIAGILFVRVLSSMLLNKLLFYGTIINVSANISLNYILMKYFGINGIALATSLVSVISFFYCGICLYKSLNWNKIEYI